MIYHDYKNAEVWNNILSSYNSGGRFRRQLTRAISAAIDNQLFNLTVLEQASKLKWMRADTERVYATFLGKEFDEVVNHIVQMVKEKQYALARIL